jgi:hypothetical protein
MPEDGSDASRVRTREHGSWVELFPFVLFGVTLLAAIVAIVLT